MQKGNLNEEVPGCTQALLVLLVKYLRQDSLSTLMI
jgi:hypothetical protein